jgi:hypothetical protein
MKDPLCSFGIEQDSPHALAYNELASQTCRFTLYPILRF